MGDGRPAAVSIIPVASLPLVRAGDDLAHLTLAAGLAWEAGDILVLAQKIVSKAEGRAVRLADVAPSARAREIAAQAHKDARLVELILSESTEVLRVRPGVIVVEHRLGLVLANAGIDASNVDHSGGESALLLPLDPDASAARIRAALAERLGFAPGVLVIDSIGRAWRGGTIGTAIGASGVPTLLDLRGRPDLYGRPLATSDLGFADEVAAAASLVMGQAGEGVPAAIVRGLVHPTADMPAAALQRPRALDMFR